MALIRKHASLLAVAAILLMMVAAPFLVPENPDSEVFRSGMLGALLLCACYMPIQQAYAKANLRLAVCALSLGLFFALSLSLGAELRHYNALLPGMGSMLRRLAVPCMAAPFFGGLFARAMLARTESPARRTANLSMRTYMLLMLLCWLPLLIAYYPAMLNYDLMTEYRQFFYREWDHRHPLLYIVLTYAVYALGRLIDQPELALFAVTLIRAVCFAAALAYSCVFLQRRRAPRWALALLTAAYCVLPIFSVMAVSSAKDTPFAAALLVLSLLGWEAIEDPKAFFASKKKCLIFALMLLFTYHLRKNGVAALVLMLPLLIAAVKGFRAKMTALCAAGLAASLLLNSAMIAVFKPFDQPSFQLYSLPAQQLVRAYNMGDMTEEEKEELRGWYLEEYGLTLYPHLADAAKGYLRQDRLDAEADQFLDLWLRVGKKNLRVYAEAFLMLNVGAWYPDDLTHAEIYNYEAWNPKGYLQLNEFNFDEYGVEKYNPIPPIRNLCEKLFRYNEYQKYPVLPQLLCTATPLWVILFACAMLIVRKKTRFLPVAAGVMTLWLSYLFGPCTLARYMLPLFCLAPSLLILAFISRD